MALKKHLRKLRISLIEIKIMKKSILLSLWFYSYLKCILLIIVTTMIIFGFIHLDIDSTTPDELANKTLLLNIYLILPYIFMIPAVFFLVKKMKYNLITIIIACLLSMVLYNLLDIRNVFNFINDTNLKL